MKLTRATVLRSMWLAPAARARADCRSSQRRSGPSAARPAVHPPVAGSPALVATRPAQPIPATRQRIDDAQRAALRMIARRTWLFFEELFTPADHWLIPDNYQEDRADLIAHRTSPTNIGLQLHLHARGLRLRLPERRRRRRTAGAGVRDAAQAASATAATSTTGTTPGRWRRWLPEYVSSVDSGNLAGYLLTTRMGLLQLAGGAAHRRRAPSTGCATRSVFATSAWRRRLSVMPPRPHGRSRRELARAGRGAVASARRRPRLAGTLLARIDDHLVEYRAWRSASSKIRRSPSAEEPAVARGGTWLEQSRGRARRPSRVSADGRRRTSRISPNAPSASPVSPTISSKRWTSDSSSTASGDCSRSATTSSTAASTRSFYDALASEARLTSFVAIATGQIAPEHWFKLGRSLTPTGTRARAAVVERVDVRVLHAAAGDARLSRHAAGRDLPRRDRAADALRRDPQGAVGNFRVGLLRARPGPELPVPRLRRARPRTQARARRRPGDRPLRQHAGRAARRRRRRCAISSDCAVLGMSGRYGFYEAIDFTPAARAGEGRRAASSCAPTWRITRACRWWRSTTRSTTSRCSGAFTTTRGCSRPICCCRSGSRTRCR